MLSRDADAQGTAARRGRGVCGWRLRDWPVTIARRCGPRRRASWQRMPVNAMGPFRSRRPTAPWKRPRRRPDHGRADADRDARTSRIIYHGCARGRHRSTRRGAIGWPSRCSGTRTTPASCSAGRRAPPPRCSPAAPPPAVDRRRRARLGRHPLRPRGRGARPEQLEKKQKEKCSGDARYEAWVKPTGRGRCSTLGWRRHVHDPLTPFNPISI